MKIIILLILTFIAVSCAGSFNLIIIGASPSDEYTRYKNSLNFYKINYTELDIAEYTGSPEWRKVAIKQLRDEISKHSDDRENVVMVTRGNEPIFLAPAQEIVDEFKKMKYQVVASHDGTDTHNTNGSICPKNFIGYAYFIKDHINIEDYLCINPKKHLGLVRIDRHSRIFHLASCNGLREDLVENKTSTITKLVHKTLRTEPKVLYAGLVKTYLNQYSNYLQPWWRAGDYQDTRSHTLSVPRDIDLPTVMISIFLSNRLPFLQEFFQNVYSLKYPKSKIYISINNAHFGNIKEMDVFVEKFQKYYTNSFTISDHTYSASCRHNIRGLPEAQLKEIELDRVADLQFTHYLHIDGTAHLTNPYLIQELISHKRSIVAPMLSKPGSDVANFWDEWDDYAGYSRYYKDIVHNKKRGIWNVPCVSTVYLINLHHKDLKEMVRERLYTSYEWLNSATLSFCKHHVDFNKWMYITNLNDYGHIISPEFPHEDLSHELYQLSINRFNWEKRYLHPDYHTVTQAKSQSSELCGNAFQFPLVSERYRHEMIAEMKKYESVMMQSDDNYRYNDEDDDDDEEEDDEEESAPTKRNTNFEMILNENGTTEHWNMLLNTYILAPFNIEGFNLTKQGIQVTSKVLKLQSYIKSKPTASVLRVSIELNEAEDFEGGGVYLREKKCSLKKSKPGWATVHPATEEYTPQYVTAGTQYLQLIVIEEVSSKGCGANDGICLDKDEL